MAEQRKRLSVGLFKKNESNKMEDYEVLVSDPPRILTQDVNKNIQIMVQSKLQEMKENPQQFFNFGFTYNDFKAYLFKLTYCRAVRKFIERKRLQRISEFQRNNNLSFGMEAENNEYN